MLVILNTTAQSLSSLTHYKLLLCVQWLCCFKSALLSTYLYVSLQYNFIFHYKICSSPASVLSLVNGQVLPTPHLSCESAGELCGVDNQSMLR